jgi:LmbE family N-acetylglucosaminyl deacetylase
MKKIVAIGAHPDDVEIGVGGTLARHVAEGDDVLIIVMTGGGASGVVSERKVEAENAAKVIGAKLVVLDFADSFLYKSHTEMVKEIEANIKDFKPDRGYIHYGNEYHADHVAVSKACLSALRNCKQVLFYEGPTTLKQFSPDYCVDISNYLDKKKEALLAHKSQADKKILDMESIMAMAKFRGFQVRQSNVEAFEIFRFFDLFSLEN